MKGFRWHKNGTAVLSGKILELFNRLDCFFLTLAKEWGAEEFIFPPLITVKELHNIEYFYSFPHLASFVTYLKPGGKNIKDFMNNIQKKDNTVALANMTPIQEVLPSAACYHFYIYFQNQNFKKTKYLTTRVNCFRRETSFLPLERQWGFSMREIVCIGDAADVKNFLAQNKAKLQNFFNKHDLPVKWEKGTDPFFSTSRNPQYIFQEICNLKSEALFLDYLAISSINFHRNRFGNVFNINFKEKPAYSACIGFGVERWLFMFLTCFGKEINNWPDLKI